MLLYYCKLMCNRHQYTFTGNFCQKEELMAVEGHDAERRGRESLTHIHKSTCVTPRTSNPAAVRICVCLHATPCRHRRVHTRRRGRSNRWLRIAAGESSDQLRLAFLCASLDHGFPRSFPVTHHLPLFSRCLSRSYVRSESRGGSH